MDFSWMCHYCWESNPDSNAWCLKCGHYTVNCPSCFCYTTDSDPSSPEQSFHSLESSTDGSCESLAVLSLNNNSNSDSSNNNGSNNKNIAAPSLQDSSHNNNNKNKEQSTRSNKTPTWICHWCNIATDKWCLLCGHDVRACTRCFELPPMMSPLAPLLRDSEGRWRRDDGVVKEEGRIRERRFNRETKAAVRLRK